MRVVLMVLLGLAAVSLASCEVGRYIAVECVKDPSKCRGE